MRLPAAGRQAVRGLACVASGSGVGMQKHAGASSGKEPGAGKIMAQCRCHQRSGKETKLGAAWAGRANCGVLRTREARVGTMPPWGARPAAESKLGAPSRSRWLLRAGGCRGVASRACRSFGRRRGRVRAAGRRLRQTG